MDQKQQALAAFIKSENSELTLREIAESLLSELTEEGSLNNLPALKKAVLNYALDAAGQADDDEAEILPGATRQEVGDVMLSDIVGDYETPDQVPEWGWIERNASYSHVHNGVAGVWEFVLNLSRTFDSIPAKLLPMIEDARRNHLSYLIIHQGT